jgi:hypothetical protein
MSDAEPNDRERELARQWCLRGGWCQNDEAAARFLASYRSELCGQQPTKPTTGDWVSDARGLLEMGAQSIDATTVRELLKVVDERVRNAKLYLRELNVAVRTTEPVYELLHLMGHVEYELKRIDGTPLPPEAEDDGK